MNFFEVFLVEILFEKNMPKVTDLGKGNYC